VIGFAGILLQGAAGDLNPEQSRQVGMIAEAGGRLLHLVEEILDLAKAEAKRVEITRETLPAATLVREVVALMQPVAAARSLVLAEGSNVTECSIRSDAQRIRQILLNLVSNGIRFTDAGRVEVGLSVPGSGMVEFWVRDTGVGIPERHLQRIFEPFVQADEPGLCRPGGTGLGLALCKEYAELLGGEISVESQVGLGSTFTLRVPLDPGD
jgi:hypothetical protein